LTDAQNYNCYFDIVNYSSWFVLIYTI
jgi:hypothetical protein